MASNRRDVYKIYVDAGNADIKWVTASGEHQHFQHALAQIDRERWNADTRNGTNIPPGYYEVNGKHYVIGQHASRHQVQQPKGAARYYRGYYGVLCAKAMHDGYERGSSSVILHSTFAPSDNMYVDSLIESAMGEWVVRSSKGESTFNVRRVLPLDEPLGGLYYYSMTKSGYDSSQVDISTKQILVVDIGGYTTDVVPVRQGRDVNYLDMRSFKNTGVLQKIDNFETAIRQSYISEFQNFGDLPRHNLLQGMMTGEYPYGNTSLPCHDQADDARLSLANDVADVIVSYGGAGSYNMILLTGGGAALVYDYLIVMDKVRHLEFKLVEDDFSEVRYANILGARKFFTGVERANPELYKI